MKKHPDMRFTCNKNGRLHSFDRQPSVQYYDSSKQQYVEEWHRNGHLLGRRTISYDLSIEFRDADGQYHSLYGLPAHVDKGDVLRYYHGVPHGLMEFNNGEKQYWIKGKQVKDHKFR